MSNATFVVHGGFIGKYSTGGTASTHKDGTYTGQGTTTLTYNPGLNFKPGELVSVTLTTGLQNGGGQALVAAKVFQFRAAAGAGPGVFAAGSDVEAGVAKKPIIGRWGTWTVTATSTWSPAITLRSTRCIWAMAAGRFPPAAMLRPG